MSDLHKQVFAAIEALPKPVTAEQALATGKSLIQDAKGQQQWAQWVQSNGAQLIRHLNGE